jgi:glycosyltransferase involved in cell wall biosynthesis
MTESRSPLVTVVTAAEGPAADLAVCIDSVLAQTYREWDYVIVDDGRSPDVTQLLRQYAGKDGRIRIVSGTAAPGRNGAMNHGLRHIAPAAQYCKVVEPRGWLYPQCLARLVAVADAHPNVALVGGFALESEWVRGDGLPYPSTSVPGREVGRQSLFRELAALGSPTSVLWRASVVRERNPFYDADSLHAHTKTCYEVLQKADFGFVHQVLSSVRPDTGFAYFSHAGTLGKLICLERYGPVFATPEDAPDFAALRARLWRDYYTLLGRCRLQRRGAEFWNYHRGELGRIGKRIEPTRLAAGVARAIWDLVRHPLDVPAAIVRRLVSARA